ncbi:hypothetical protein HAX54_010993 [Datura stramonium]|uniref:Uncharacterized protein n=1 Tax=Datura stramonium TaxID=4076 RepID=A0ABS8TH52_DATST|nr:hypothetical protein [Datura stramonium]
MGLYNSQKSKLILNPLLAQSLLFPTSLKTRKFLNALHGQTREELEVYMRREETNKAYDCLAYEDNGDPRIYVHDLQLTFPMEINTTGGFESSEVEEDRQGGNPSGQMALIEDPFPLKINYSLIEKVIENIDTL